MDPYYPSSSYPTQRDGPRYQDPSLYPFSSSRRPAAGAQYYGRYEDEPDVSYRRNMKADIISNLGSEPKSTFDHVDSPKDEWMATNVKSYRKGVHGRNLYTRGGALWSFGRFFCCSLFIIIYLAVIAVLGLALWLRPPSLTFVGPGLDPTQQPALEATGVTVPLELNVTVNNPNYFSVDFKYLKAEVLYPSVQNSVIANGNLTDLVIKTNQVTNFTFPIDISLDFSDQGSASNDIQILLDIGQKCGLLGGTKSSIPLTVKITIGVSVLGIKITPPTISFTVNINCPLDGSAIEDKLQGILKGLGGDGNNLSGILDVLT